MLPQISQLLRLILLAWPFLRSLPTSFQITIVNVSSSQLQSPSSSSPYSVPWVEYLLHMPSPREKPPNKLTTAPSGSSPAKGQVILFVLLFFICWGRAHWCLVAFHCVRCCTLPGGHNFMSISMSTGLTSLSQHHAAAMANLLHNSQELF